MPPSHIRVFTVVQVIFSAFSQSCLFLPRSIQFSVHAPFYLLPPVRMDVVAERALANVELRAGSANLIAQRSAGDDGSLIVPGVGGAKALWPADHRTCEVGGEVGRPRTAPRALGALAWSPRSHGHPERVAMAFFEPAGGHAVEVWSVDASGAGGGGSGSGGGSDPIGRYESEEPPRQLAWDPSGGTLAVLSHSRLATIAGGPAAIGPH